MKNYSDFFTIKRLWVALIVSLVLSFSALLYLGGQIYQKAPPIPNAVQIINGDVVYSKQDIKDGQNIWQTIGGMQQGSIWGHGSYLAPDWSADWLHREALSLLNIIKSNGFYLNNKRQTQEAHKITLRDEMRTNTYNDATGVVTISQDRASAIAETQRHYINLYTSNEQKYQQLREDYAFPIKIILNEEKARKLSAFFFWSAWAASTNRPGNDITYTSNWPHEPLIGNTPPPSVLLWSIISIFLLLAGIGGIVWYYASQFDKWRQNSEPEQGIATADFIENNKITPSMKATAKYFWVVTALFVSQVLLGIITAHYAVDGQGLYGIDIANYIPYAVTRTWHTQLAVFWIATAWLATGLYVAPLISGHEPKFQRFGVNFLFFSLLLIVVGSFAGQWLAVNGFIEDLTLNFWFGHQGYEYIDLGRFWQIYLFIGLLLWVALLLRALLPAFKDKNLKSLLFVVVLATVSIGLLYAAGFMWGKNTNLSIVEYWRWWVVHLWVEGVFEVFATAIISVLFVRMGLLRTSVATTMVIFTTIIFLGGGVLGTLHHLYWSGTPISIMAVGASFSALEVVPLVVIGFEAYNHKKLENQQTWQENYHWPFMFFSAVLFWNLVGAGLFGFLINPPIALYYMQGLNITANHGHAALFGVYGMLGLGLMLYAMRGLTDIKQWDTKLLKITFWSLNIGLAMMTFLSLLPQGLWQTYQSISQSYVSARSVEFMQSDIMHALVWARVPGDTVFAVGVFAFAWFVFKAFVVKK
ncbi:Nitric-oxide reductase, quinol-dependent [uncultured Candidatus Thioglobus sp.]|nr:Nitric-oxide reductase, quinol-dependent [uncultured Candidatus Thioglobus sp.]